MSHGVKNFYWRAGRPRWIIGPGLRARGFRGQDLKDDEGNWLQLEPARLKAAELNAEAGVADLVARAAPTPPTPRAEKRGFVYFLLVGEHMKIGFTKHPDRRLMALRTAISGDVALYVAVPGTAREEQNLHALLHRHRLNGEWFVASQQVMNVVLRCVKLRRVTYGQTAVHLRETS